MEEVARLKADVAEVQQALQELRSMPERELREEELAMAQQVYQGLIARLEAMESFVEELQRACSQPGAQH